METRLFDIALTLLGAGLIALALFHRSGPRLANTWRIYRQFLPTIVVVLVTVVFAIGILDARRKNEVTSVESISSPSELGLDTAETTLPTASSDATTADGTDRSKGRSGVVNAIQLLRLDSDEDTPGFLGHLGRGGAVLLWVIMGIELNRLFLYSAIQAWQLTREKDHFVICGMGSLGWQLTKNLQEQGKRVVVIESDGSNAYLDEARENGAIVLTRDATDEKVLASVRPEHATELYAVTGSDTQNAAIVTLLNQLVTKRNAEKEPTSVLLTHQQSPISQRRQSTCPIRES